MYLLGAPRFKIVTAHKPIVPMFNKPTAKLPPRIEKWVMDMQDVDYELVYEPGKDEADPLDFLSRHPLPETGSDKTEKMIKQIVMDEHAVVLDKVKDETTQDPQLSKLKQRITRDDWEAFRKDDDIKPFYPIRHELYIAEGMIFRLNTIVIPATLQRKVIKAAHKMGHLGMREKYWFPKMNTLTEQMIGQCYECQVTTKQHRQEPIKMTTIPDKPWDVIAVDSGGPYPDGHYNLVAVDKRTRYPEVETTHSTSFKATRTKMKKMFATHGIPNRVETDNGPPFNSKEFKEFAKEEGFEHKTVTPDHARANGEAEAFMKTLNKVEQITHLQKQNREIAVHEMLMGYRSTPHPATQVTPYEALMGRPVRTKLDYVEPQKTTTDRDTRVNERDKQYKERLKQQKENRNTKSHNLVLGDFVLLKQQKRNKWTTAFEPAFYVVYRIDGSSVAARRITDGREVYRDGSQFKLVNSVMQNQDQTITNDTDAWRESLLQETVPDDNLPTPGDDITPNQRGDLPNEQQPRPNAPTKPTIPTRGDDLPMPETYQTPGRQLKAVV
ncbi:uncharacterized protein K02A2.6-like [Lytechinus variegatus]|uniref:uncharacterized protein K02A2.6-like n=1 Tax=Lytechinus variegatus TaxID=7654 RepID=UPI001BB24617|nr:uncharacterized protein K02A2.6-like [Lytechinus variegatus]